MAKIQIKSEKLTSFGDIFPIIEKFDRMVGDVIVGIKNRDGNTNRNPRFQKYYRLRILG